MLQLARRHRAPSKTADRVAWILSAAPRRAEEHSIEVNGADAGFRGTCPQSKSVPVTGIVEIRKILGADGAQDW